jgi:putative membrane protein
MTKLLWLLKWILKAAIFFTLFAFALNNQHEVVMHFFFGYQWTAPLVLIVLAVFALGLLLGCLGMSLTSRQRRTQYPNASAIEIPPKSDGI